MAIRWAHLLGYICAALLVYVSVAQAADPKDPQYQAREHQHILRSLGDYLNLFPRDFAEDLKANRNNPSFHWMDVGAGSARAMTEAYYDTPIAGEDGASTAYFPRPFHRANADLSQEQPTACFQGTAISVEDIAGFLTSSDSAEIAAWARRRLKTEESRARAIADITALVPWFRKVTQAGKHSPMRYLHGKTFQEYREGSITKADLITDYYGAFAYAPDKFDMLLRYARGLKTGGRALVVIPPDDHFRVYLKRPGADMKSLHPDSFERSIPFADFVDSLNVPGLRVLRTEEAKGETVLELHATPEALDALEYLRGVTLRSARTAVLTAPEYHIYMGMERL